MNIWDGLVIIVSLVLLVGVPRRIERRWTHVLLAVLGLSLLVHFSLGDPRWQMWPAYSLAAVGTIAALLRLRRPERRRRSLPLRVVGYGSAAVFGTLSLLLPTAIPVFQWPAPGGSYAVGVRTFALIDQARPERHASGHPPREVLIKAWYPALPSSAAFAPYTSKAAAAALSRRLQNADGEGPTFLLTHLSKVRTHSVQDAPPVSGRFPVLLFSHGFSGTITQNTRLMEDLASHGYVVLSVGHPYGAAVLEYPDGRIITLAPTNLERDLAGAEVVRLANAMNTESDPKRYEAVIREILQKTAVVDGFMRDAVADLHFVIATLSVGQLGNQLDRMMDPGRIGVFGHSLGGATAAQLCLEEVRCRAALNIDGMQYGDLTRRDLPKPFLMIYMDHPNRGLMFNDMMYRANPYGSNRFPAVVIGQTGHLDGSDLTMAFAPWVKRFFPAGSPIGPINGDTAARTLDDIVRGFFDEQLKGRNGALSAAIQRHREVTQHRAAVGSGPVDRS